MNDPEAEFQEGAIFPAPDPTHPYATDADVFRRAAEDEHGEPEMRRCGKLREE